MKKLITLFLIGVGTMLSSELKETKTVYKTYTWNENGTRCSSEQISYLYFRDHRLVYRVVINDMLGETVWSVYDQRFKEPDGEFDDLAAAKEFVRQLDKETTQIHSLNGSGIVITQPYVTDTLTAK